MFYMKNNLIWIIAAIVVVVLVLGYLGRNQIGSMMGMPTTEPTQVMQPTEAPIPTAMTPEGMKVNLDEVNDSGQSGTAMLTEENGNTTVALDLTGFTAGLAQPAHIHIGECPGVGEVKYPLENVADGKSVTVLPVTLAEITKDLPLAINVHKSAAEVKVYTACGELSSQ